MSLQFVTYSYTSTVSGSFGLQNFVELCKKGDQGKYYSDPFDSGRWKIQFSFNEKDYPMDIGVYLMAVPIGEETNYTSSTARKGKYSFSFTLRAEQHEIAKQTFTDVTFFPKADVTSGLGWGKSQFVAKASVPGFAPNHETIILDYKIIETHPEI